MNHIKHDACNDVLGAPPGEEAHCEALHIQRAVTSYVEDAAHCVCSFWKPTQQELALLNANGCVRFLVVGVNHPPIAVDVVES